MSPVTLVLEKEFTNQMAHKFKRFPGPGQASENAHRVSIPGRWQTVFGPRPLLREIKHDPSGPDGKESTCNAGDPDWILELGRFPGEGNGN